MEGFDLTITLFSVITFATSCKSFGGVQLEEDSSFKAMSISNISAIMNKTRTGSLITVERYTRTCGQSITLTEACDSTHVVIYYQRKTMTFCIEDFDQEQEYCTISINSTVMCHRPQCFVENRALSQVTKPSVEYVQQVRKISQKSFNGLYWSCKLCLPHGLVPSLASCNTEYHHNLLVHKFTSCECPQINFT